MVYVETETQTQSQWPTRHLGTDLAERTQQTRECKRKKYKTSKHRPLKHKYQDNHLRISFFYVHIALLFRSLYVHQQVQNVELFSLFFGLDFNFRIAVVVFIPGFTFFFFFTDFVQQGAISSYVALEAGRSVSHLDWLSWIFTDLRLSSITPGDVYVYTAG